MCGLCALSINGGKQRTQHSLEEVKRSKKKSLKILFSGRKKNNNFVSRRKKEHQQQEKHNQANPRNWSKETGDAKDAMDKKNNQPTTTETTRISRFKVRYLLGRALMLLLMCFSFCSLQHVKIELKCIASKQPEL